MRRRLEQMLNSQEVRGEVQAIAAETHAAAPDAKQPGAVSRFFARFLNVLAVVLAVAIIGWILSWNQQSKKRKRQPQYFYKN